MKTKLIALIAIIIILIAGAWWLLQKKPGQTANFNPSQTANPNVTQVLHFDPATPAGQQQSGDCFASSVAALSRTDAWRCLVGEMIYDPCFSVKQLDTVVCGADPILGNGGFALILKRPLPAPTTGAQIPAAWGWLVLLKDGTICAPITGSRAQIDDKLTTYGCKQTQGTANVVILGDLDSSKPLWTAQVATISFADNKIKADKVQTLGVAKVWQ